MTKKGCGESTDKITLTREHAVTSGEPVIAAPLSADKIRVLIETLESGNYSSIKSDVYDGMLHNAPDYLKSLVNRFVELDNITEPLAVTIQTNLPPLRGLGSSTIVAVAPVCAGCDFLGKSLAKEELIEKVNWARQVAYGKSSSIDTQTAVSGRPVWFQKGHAETLKTLSLDDYMVAIDIGVKGSTRQAVEDIRKFCEGPQYMSHVKHIGKLVLHASDVIEYHNFGTLADIFNECRVDLKALTVSHDKIEQSMKIGKENGTAAGKLTGTGRGGSMLLLTKDLSATKNIVKAVEKAGAVHTWIKNLRG